MDASLNHDDPRFDGIRARDAIIHALYLKLKAEIETREAIIEAAQAGASAEVLEAIATDPVPEIDDLGKDRAVRTLIETGSIQSHRPRMTHPKIGH